MSPDFIAHGITGVVGCGKGIVGRNVVAGTSRAYINTEHFTQQALRILGIILWIATRAAIAHADVQIAIGSKECAAPVVVGVGLVDGEEDLL